VPDAGLRSHPTQPGDAPDTAAHPPLTLLDGAHTILNCGSRCGERIRRMHTPMHVPMLVDVSFCCSGRSVDSPTM